MAGSWFEKLRAFIDSKIDLRNFRLINITINNNQVTTTDQRTQTVHINVKELSSEDREKLFSSVRDAVLDEGHLLLEASAEKRVEDIQQVETSADFLQLIEYLRPYIPSTDLLILKAALYLRKKYSDGAQDVQRLKNEIVERYGDRGRKIANLCSAGYFESMIIPLLDEMKSAPDVADEFSKSYETIIAESGFAVFVHMAMTAEQITAVIKARIKSNYKYGKKYLHIHGIGKLNLTKIRKCVDELLEELTGLEKPIDKKIGSAIYIRLEFTAELGKALCDEKES